MAKEYGFPEVKTFPRLRINFGKKLPFTKSCLLLIKAKNSLLMYGYTGRKIISVLVYFKFILNKNSLHPSYYYVSIQAAS